MVFIIVFLFNQINEVWRYNYNGGQNDFGYFISFDKNYNIIAAGLTERESNNYDIILFKFTPNGELQWLRKFETTGNEGISGIIVDNENSIYVAGATFTATHNWDYLLLKYDSSGNFCWQRTFGGNGYDYAKDITIDEFNNIYLTGVMEFSYLTNVGTYKLNKNGEIIWFRNHYENNSLANWGEKIIYDGEGNIFITGSVDFSISGSDILTIKYDTSGNFYWSKIYSTIDYNEWGKVIAIDSSRNILVSGYNYHPATGEDWVVLKYDQNGRALFQRRYGRNYTDDEAKSITIDEINNFYITGFINSYFVINKFNPNGQLSWERIIDGGYGNKIIYYQNYLYTTGSNNDFLTVKYDKEGNEIWRINGNAGFFSEGNDIIIRNNEIYVIGTSQQDILIIKYQESANIKEEKKLKKNLKSFDLLGRKRIIYNKLKEKIFKFSH